LEEFGFSAVWASGGVRRYFSAASGANQELCHSWVVVGKLKITISLFLLLCPKIVQKAMPAKVFAGKKAK
jgi:hypothetical protein